MENVPTGRIPVPAGDCGGLCSQLAGHPHDLQQVAGHNRFIERFIAEDAIAMAALVESLVFAGGPPEEHETEPGVPHPLLLIRFVEQHRWPNPEAAQRLAWALTDLHQGQVSIEPGALEQRRDPSAHRCRHRW